MLTRWFSSVRVFLVWLLGFSLVLVLLALLHDLLMFFIVNTLHWQKYIVRFTGMLYYFPAGLVCIAYFVFSYQFLNRSVRQGRLARSSLLLLGVQLLLIGLTQLGLLGYQYLKLSGLTLILIAGEILVGVIFLFLVLRQPQQVTG